MPVMKVCTPPDYSIIYDDYSDFYSRSVLSNKLELFISRVINYFNLTGEIEVIISAKIE